MSTELVGTARELGHIWNYVPFKVHLEDRTILRMFLSRGEDARGEMGSIVKILDFLESYNVLGTILRTLHTFSHLILVTTQ